MSPPEVEKPKRNIDPEEKKLAARESTGKRGRESLVVAGRLPTKALGRKSSLLG